MSETLLKKIVKSRNLIVAVVNAAVTWVILIIAPLGLFAVIICTIGVFISSLAVGFLGDWAMFSLMEEEERIRLQARRNRADIREDFSQEIDSQDSRNRSRSDRTIQENKPRKNLPQNRDNT